MFDYHSLFSFMILSDNSLVIFFTHIYSEVILILFFVTDSSLGEKTVFCNAQLTYIKHILYLTFKSLSYLFVVLFCADVAWQYTEGSPKPRFLIAFTIKNMLFGFEPQLKGQSARKPQIAGPCTKLTGHPGESIHTSADKLLLVSTCT